MMDNTMRISRPEPTLLLVMLMMLGVLVPTANVRAAVGPALVQIVETSAWQPPSPDPSGITYWPRKDHLVLVDGEVEEMDIWAGANMFESTRAGSLVKTYDLTSFNKEPVGIDIEIADNDHFFISNDSQKTIFDVDIGPDGEFGTGDDKRRPFLTSGWGNTDPEGLTLGGGKLYTVDGSGQRVYITEPGSNGIFEASDPSTSFGVSAIGIKDPEGIDYDPNTGNLWIVDRSGRRVNEVTTAGNLLRSIDLKALAGAVNPGDVTLAPASVGSGNNLYIVDRGIDNNVDPDENDGKIYEITLAGDAPVSSGNLLANPGFELDSDGDSSPDDWSTEAGFTRSNRPQPAPAGVDLGTYSGKFVGTSNGSITSTQKETNITPGTPYNFSGWVNIPATSDSFSFEFQLRWKQRSNVLRTDVLDTASVPRNGEWSQVSGRVTAPSGADTVIVRLVARKLDTTFFVDGLVLQTLGN